MTPAYQNVRDAYQNVRDAYQNVRPLFQPLTGQWVTVPFSLSTFSTLSRGGEAFRLAVADAPRQRGRSFPAPHDPQQDLRVPMGTMYLAHTWRQ